MAMIRPETEMKDSGIQWIGDIPNDWDVRRLKYVLNERKEKNDPLVTDNILSLSAEQGVIPFSERIGGGNKPKEDLTAYKVVRAGDIVLNSMNVLSGAVHYSNYTGCVSPVYYMLYNENDVITRYYNLVFQTEAFQRSLRGLGNGILIKETDEGKLNTIRMRIPMEKLNKVKLPSPSFDEMKKVVESIEPIRSKIDEIIAEANASIDEYKELKQSVIFEAVTKGLDKNVEMKDSGVEWIGEIPVDWNIAKINRVAWTTSGATPLRSKETEYYDNAVIRWVRTLDLNNGHVTDSSEKITETALNNSSCSIMPVKTVCVAMYGGSGTIGKSGILEVECATNQAICSIVSDKKVLNPDYLHYVIMAVRKYWMKYAVGTRKDPNINQQIIAQMRIPIPQLSKQDIIVNHLDKVTDKCDSLISEKESLINDLEAYKKSLIYEVVTGKRRVV